MNEMHDSRHDEVIKVHGFRGCPRALHRRLQALDKDAQSCRCADKDILPCDNQQQGCQRRASIPLLASSFWIQRLTDIGNLTGVFFRQEHLNICLADETIRL
jgi:hypothetical protein